MKRQTLSGFMRSGQAIVKILWDIRYNGLSLFIYNTLWFFCCLPLVTAPAATAALYTVTREIGYSRPVDIRFFFAEMRRKFWLGWRWFLLNGGMGLLAVVNLWFYRQLAGEVGVVLQAIWLQIIILWLAVQMYCFPLVLAQEKASIVLAVRNAAVLLLRFPRYTFTFTVLTLLCLLVSWWSPYFLMFMTAGLLTYIHNRAVYYLIAMERGDDPFTDAPVDTPYPRDYVPGQASLDEIHKST